MLVYDQLPTLPDLPRRKSKKRYLLAGLNMASREVKLSRPDPRPQQAHVAQFWRGLTVEVDTRKRAAHPPDGRQN
jgi:hypothetical protein